MAWHSSFRQSLDRFAANIHLLSLKVVIYNSTLRAYAPLDHRQTL
jgi:hypothetical protein